MCPSQTSVESGTAPQSLRPTRVGGEIEALKIRRGEIIPVLRAPGATPLRMLKPLRPPAPPANQIRFAQCFTWWS
jgi:hypothetical protein